MERETKISKKAFYGMMSDIFRQRRKYLRYEIKTVSSITKISKEDLVKFEKNETTLSIEQIELLAKFYLVSLNTLLKYIENKNIHPSVEKELKKNNNNINKKQLEELSSLVGFSGYKK